MGRRVILSVPGRCSTLCVLCECRRITDKDALRRGMTRLGGGGERLEVRGGPQRDGEAVEQILERGRRAGFQRLVLQTSAVEYQELEKAQELARKVDAVLIPLFSSQPQVHDRLAGAPDSLVKTLLGMRSLSAAGLGIELEVPLLASKIQDLEALLTLAQRAVPKVDSVRFWIPPETLPPALVCDSTAEMGDRLVRVLDKCLKDNIRVQVTPHDGIPFCAVAGESRLLKLIRFKPGQRRGPVEGSGYAQACAGCSMIDDCGGVRLGVLRAFGSRGVKPFPKEVQELDQRTTPRRVWTEEQKEASRQVRNLVLRPTVHCNQDCKFCSANETSSNVWGDREMMLRAIARAARRNIEYFSLSGGEPTLSPHLASYIRTARRLGVKIVELVTNGVLLDEERRVRPLVEAGLTNVFISLHSHNESISRAITQKSGDFARTVKAISLLSQTKVVISLNHVVNELNYRYLQRFIEFVHGEWEGRVNVSIAYVTPQFMALENISLVPKYSDVMPYLRRALHRAVELGQRVVVGSRQGIPPCLLGEFEGWSDVLYLAREAASEDQHQKTKAPGCVECAYDKVCQGVWKPYAERYGLTELVPLRRPEGYLDSIRQSLMDLGAPGQKSFEVLPEALRHPSLEAEGRLLLHSEEPLQVESRVSLPLLTLKRYRPVRMAMLGSGRQARRLFQAMRSIPDVTLVAVASPHAPEKPTTDFGGCPQVSDAAQALELRPEGVVIASSTPTHLSLAREALTLGLPVLLEKPLTRTEEEGEALVALVAESDAGLVAAHPLLYAPELRDFLEPSRTTRLRLGRLVPANADDAPKRWSRAALFELLYHLFTVLDRGAGGGVAQVTAASFSGDSRPQALSFSLQYPGALAELKVDFAAPLDELSVSVETSDGRARSWRRQGREVLLSSGDGRSRSVPFEGTDESRLLEHFRSVVLKEERPYTTAAEGLHVFKTSLAAVRALAQAGAPFEQRDAPRHVASRELQLRLR